MRKVIFLLSVLILVMGSTIYVSKNVKKVQKQEPVEVENNADAKEIDSMQIIEESNVEEELFTEKQEFEEEEVGKKEIQQPKQNDKSTNTSKKEQVEIPKEVPKEEQPTTSSKVEENKQEPVKEEKPKEPEIDEEYERLKKQVQYSTYEECMNAGFEIALSDTVNILGFDSIPIIYKGKIIGYRLQINYTNPMEN